MKNRRRRALRTDSGAAHPESGAAHLALHRSPLIIGIGARAALPEAGRGGGHGGWLCGLCALTVFVKSGKCAINGIPAQPGHIEDRRKALLNARTSVEPYQGLDVADQEKQDGEPPMRT